MNHILKTTAPDNRYLSACGVVVTSDKGRALDTPVNKICLKCRALMGYRTAGAKPKRSRK